MEVQPTDSASKTPLPFRTQKLIHPRPYAPLLDQPEKSGSTAATIHEDELSKLNQVKQEKSKIEQLSRLKITPISEPKIEPKKEQRVPLPPKKKASNRRHKLFEKKSPIPAEYAQTRISDFFNQNKAPPVVKPFLMAEELGENSQIKKYKGFFKAPVPQNQTPALGIFKRPKKREKPFEYSRKQGIKKPEEKAGGKLKERRVYKMVAKEQNAVKKISNNEIRKLARRGGVQRVGADIYNDIREKLRTFLEGVIHGAMDLTEQRGRNAVSAIDVVQSLKAQGAIKQ